MVGGGHSTGTSSSPTWVEVDLCAVRHNVQVLKHLSPKRTKLIAVIKADAYGHGAVPVAFEAMRAGAWGLAVARVQEGVRLRLAGVEAPILVLGYAAEPELPLALNHELDVTVSGWRTALALSSLAVTAGRVARLHLKVDTGMHRYGVPVEEARHFAEVVRTLPGVTLEGLYTHFATADERDSTAFQQQVHLFDDLVRDLAARGIRPLMVHAANSAATARGIDCPSYDAVRTGIALYGVQPSNAVKLDLQPVMSLKARVGRVLDVHEGDGVSYGHDYLAETKIRAAVVTCGYADGYMRSLGGKGEVLISGHRCQVLGRVCMDSVVVHLPDGVETAEGCEVVLLGRQGRERVSAEELSDRAGTIAYELLCGMGQRAERVYSD